LKRNYKGNAAFGIALYDKVFVTIFGFFIHEHQQSQFYTLHCAQSE